MSKLTDSITQPLRAETPAPQNRGSAMKTEMRRKQMKANPNTWFVYSESVKSASAISFPLKTLTGLSSLTGLDRSTLDYEVTCRRQEDGTYRIYARYTGNSSSMVQQEYSDA